MRVSRVDNKVVRSSVMSIDPIKREELKITKSALWYQHGKIKGGKVINSYEKTRVKMKWIREVIRELRQTYGLGIPP